MSGPPPPRDRALTIDAARLARMLRDERAVTPELEPQLDLVAHALHGLFHHEFQAVKQRLRSAWDELSGEDGATQALTNDQREHARDLLATLRKLLTRANYVEVPVGELIEAMRRRATFGLAIELDFDDFENLVTWRRRVVPRTERVMSLFGLRARRIEVEAYDRFCLYARFKPERHFAALGSKGKTKKKLGIPPGGVTLRLFRDVPKHDVEALFPGIRVRMRAFDRALIGVPAAAGVMHLVIFKLWTSIGALGLAILVVLGLRREEPEVRAKAIAACVGLAVLLAFLFRQWLRFLGRKNLLHRQLAEHLHVRSLDHGIGVLFHLIDEAEQAETAEALLAYTFLVRAGRPVEREELDRQVEQWLQQRLGLEVDFEEEDALAKLERLGLVARTDTGALTALAPKSAAELLQARWNDLLRKA